MLGRRYFGGRYFGPRYFGGSGADSTSGSYFGAGFFGPRYFGRRYWSPVAGAGAEWDLAAAIDTPITGALSFSGDFAFAADSPLELTQTSSLALAGTIGISGNFGFTIPFDLAETAPLDLSGALSIAGQFSYSSAPISPPAPPFAGVAGGGGMSNVPRAKHPATVEAEEHEDRERIRIQREDEMVFDCIAALVAAEVI